MGGPGDQTQPSARPLSQIPYDNYPHSGYLVLGSVRTLEMIYSIWEDVYRVCTNPRPFYISDREHLQIPGSPSDTERQLYFIRVPVMPQHQHIVVLPWRISKSMRDNKSK